MTRNIGTLDRGLRVGVGVVAIIAALLVGAGSVVALVLFVLAAILLATSSVALCPLYKLLRLDTRSRNGLPH